MLEVSVMARKQLEEKEENEGYLEVDVMSFPKLRPTLIP